MTNDVQYYTDFNLGIAQIDADHEEIFRQFDVLREMSCGVRTCDDFYKIAKRLKEWSGYHFSHEDALMKKLEYPGIADHRREHAKFIAQISRFIKLCKPGAPGTQDTIAKFYETCIKWYQRHMETMDIDLVSFIRACDSGVATEVFSTTFRPFFERDRPDQQLPDGAKRWLG